jgi:isochorismate synthase
MFPEATAANTSDVLDRLKSLLGASGDRISAAAPDQLFSFVIPVDEHHLRPALDQGGDDYYWHRPVDAKVLAGTGTAAAFSTRGRDRFDQMQAFHRRLSAGWVRIGMAATAGPVAFAGFAFDPDSRPGEEWGELENSLVAVPSVLFHRHGSEASLCFSAPASDLSAPDDALRRWSRQLDRLERPRASPRPVLDAPALEAADAGESWHERVEQALAAIRSGGLDKVVLTRRVRLHSTRPLGCGPVMDFLDQRHDECAHFAISRDACTLLGVSPERLLAFADSRVTVDALAGTTPRGQNAGHDRRLADALITDPKVRQEHGLVVDQIRAALAPICSELNVPATPDIMRLPQVQHLWTPISARVHRDCGLLGIAERLHPTPAVGGSPRQAAADWLARSGEAERGWYTGGFGWLDPAGNGELSVVLRCGLVREHSVDLFAGAGIVAESRPEQELAETEWKLLTMQGALRLG